MGWGVEGGTSQIIENGLTLTEKHGNMSSHVLAHECALSGKVSNPMNQATYVGESCKDLSPPKIL
jgi:hypothetical protein